jgi:hypothetical protein
MSAWAWARLRPGGRELVNTRSLNDRLYRRDRWSVAADPKLTPGTALILILLFSVGLWGVIWLVASSLL